MKQQMQEGAMNLKNKAQGKFTEMDSHVTKDFDTVKYYTSLIFGVCLVLVVQNTWRMIRFS